MGHDAKGDDGECLSPGTVMALLDQQLGAEEAGRAQSHLRGCSRCQQLAADLGVAAEAVAGLRCLDDEAIAAWVDCQAGRVRGTVSEAELRRRGEHLRQCQQCRERVELLATTCAERQGLRGWLWELLAGATRPRTAGLREGWRWAAVTAAAVLMTSIVYLTMTHRAPSTPRRQVARAPIRSGAQARRPTSGQRAQQARVPRGTSAGAPLVAPPAVRSAGRAAGASGRRPTVARPPLPRPEAALIPADEETRAEMARAFRELEHARAGGDASTQAKAALALGGMYHEQRAYQSAARYYREASAAAEKAKQTQLQVDALVLEGAVLAELGQTARARQRLALALELARKAAYNEGEANALAQLELLEGQPGSRGH